MSSRTPIIALGAVVVVAAVLAFAWKRRPPVDAPVITTASVPKPLVDTAEHCAAVRTQYREALGKLQSCTSDDECIAEKQDGVRSGLDGCARFYHRDANLRASVEPLAEAWLARGCSGTFMMCRAPLAQCVSGRCAELPPAPVPRTWKRIDHRNVFSFFLPPEAIEHAVIGEDSEVGEWALPKYEVHFDFGYGANIEGSEEDDKVLHREAIDFGKTKGELLTTRMKRGVFLSGVHIDQVPSGISRVRNRLTLWIDCKEEKDCADGPIIARSLEFH